MSDVKEKYERELIYQEIKSNKYTLKGFAWFLAAFALIWVLTMVDFFEVDKNMISIAFALDFVLLTFPLCMLFRGDLSKSWLKYYFITLICVISGIIATFLSYHAVLVYVIPLLFAIQYRRRSTIWYAYIVNIITMLFSSLASFYYGICDLNILFQSQHVRSWYLAQFAEGNLTIPFNDNPIFIILVFAVLPRCIILFIFCVMLRYAVVSSNEDALRIAQLTYLKETDNETKVFNKNKYEEMISAYYPHIHRVAVSFWDLNNLKFLNDKYGHSVGDKAIERLSSVLYGYSCDRCRIYRIGGDEFLMIIDNPAENEMESNVKAVKEKLENSNILDDIKISSAVGIAYGNGGDILKIVEEADGRMYENKKYSKESCAG